MATTASELQPVEEFRDKGLKSGALGLISSTVIATASVAPAYSLAATLGFVVLAVGLKSPLVAILAFVPMILTSIGYSELNKSDPDCGTTFTWATRAFGPKTGWAGGWAIVAADILVMASLAQVAGQYIFLLFNAKGIGQNPASGWVLLTGVLWIVVMTYICYRGIEVSANFQKALLSIEITMLIVLSVVALVRVGTGHHPAESIQPSWSWLSFSGLSFSAFAAGLILMVFIYWGWDTALSVNEETKDATRTPGRSAILSTIILVVTYGIAIFGAQSFAGIGTKGIGLANANNSSDVLSVLGHAVFGAGAVGNVFYRLLLLMVLSSAAASTQTTILPTARTTLSMATYQALPPSFAKMHRKHLTPTVSTLVMGGISIVLYAAFNYMSGGQVIADAVTSCGVFIATYYGLTGFACAWYYRRSLFSSARNLWMQGILPVLGGLMLWFLGGWSLWLDWDMNSANEASYTSFTVPGLHWVIGGVFVIVFLSWVVGLLVFIYMRIVHPAFFRKETLTRSTPTLVPDNY
ncbi:MAG TPA: APC family permease [Streptosporangiaceae bacterium]|nr:APC family permease [Streptosporangiaceae bacterium]